MAERTFRLEKVAAGDYLLRFDGDETIFRLTKEEDIGSGPRGMFGITVWFLWPLAQGRRGSCDRDRADRQVGAA